MRKFFLFLFATLIFSTPALPISENNCKSLAISDFIDEPTVTLELRAEQWVTTKTALVTVSVDATLDKSNAIVVREEIMKRLSEEVAKDASWNITTFSSSQNESGLEQLHVEATARLDENLLANLRERVKNITKPGLTFKVNNIDFSPSLEELEKTKAELRANLYKEALAEAGHLNAIYPDKKYYVHSITINFAEIQPFLPKREFVGGGVMAMVPSPLPERNAPMLTVSTKAEMSALVELAAKT